MQSTAAPFVAVFQRSRLAAALALLLAGASTFGFCQTQPVEPPKAAPRVDALGDPLPPGAIARLGTERFQVKAGHLLSVAGGKAYLFNDWIIKRVENWETQSLLRWIDSESGKTIETWPLPENRVVLAISPDGRWLVLADSDEQLLRPKEKPDPPTPWRLMDLTTKKEVWKFNDLKGGRDSGTCAFSTDGKLLATMAKFQAGSDVRVWETATGKQLWANADPKVTFGILGFTADNGELILRRSPDGQIHVVDLGLGKIVRDFPMQVGNSPPVLSPDAISILVGGPRDPDIQVWDVKTGLPRPALTGHKDTGRLQMAFSPDGKTLFTGVEQGVVLVRDWPSGKVRGKLDVGITSLVVQAMFVSKDGRTLNLKDTFEQTLRVLTSTPANDYRRQRIRMKAALQVLRLGQMGQLLVSERKT